MRSAPRSIALGLLFGLTSCVGMSVPTASTSSGLYGELELDTNRLGEDYRDFDMPVADVDLCQAECDKDPQCKAFTYVKPGWQKPVARCWLKKTVPNASKHGCCVSYVKP